MSDEFNSELDSFRERYERGKQGKNLSIPMGFKRLTKYVGIRRQVYYLIGGYTGCLSGDTLIDIGRKQSTANTKKYTIKTLYNKFHGKVTKDKWNLELPTRTKVYMADKGQTGLHYIEDVVYSGVKDVYQVRTNGLKKIKATLDHRFMISEENAPDEVVFKTLRELKIGDYVICKAEKESRAKGRKLKNRKEVCLKMPYYWTARKKIVSGKEYQRVYEYRLAYDASLNNLSVGEFLEIVRNDPNHTLRLSDPKMVVHHLDENPLNNDPSNLKLLSKKEHDTLHAKTSNYGYSWVCKEKIVGIDYVGKEETYDIICDDPYHNFIANGFVVHNSGKTTFVDDAFVLNPIWWFFNENKNPDIDLKIIYFSMERSKDYKIARWLSRLIFMNEGVIIPLNIILGWERIPNKEEQEYIDRYLPLIERIFSEIVVMYEGPMKPGAMYKAIKEFAEDRGEMKDKEFVRKDGSKYKKKVYVPNNPDEIVLIITDTVNLTEAEMNDDKRMLDERATLDKQSMYMRIGRDRFGYSPVSVSQFNREIANPIRLKAGDVQPRLEDFSGTSKTQNDAEVVMALFDPIRYKVDDIYGYDLPRFIETQEYKYPGSKKYRQLSVLKNSYGPDDVGVGLGYQPQVGLFKELPFADKMTDVDYEAILDNTFFVN